MGSTPTSFRFARTSARNAEFFAVTAASDTDPEMADQSLDMDGSLALHSSEATLDAPATAAPSTVPASAVAATRPTFTEVYDGHFKAVWLALRRFGVRERDLDDATHDVFMVVHRRLDDFDASRPVRPWLLGIAVRVASEARRRSQTRHEVVSEDVDAEAGRLPMLTPPHGVRADRLYDDKERRALLQQALDTLDFDRRAVLVLHDIEGHGMPEIAAALETNINTLYARLQKARVQLKAAVVALSTSQRMAS